MARIFIIDDDEPLRSLLRHVLAGAGHEVVEAANGRECLRRLASGPVDLVITDIMMPEMDGIELIDFLHQTQPRLAVLAISGGGLRMTPNICLRMANHLGATRTLAKPFALEALLAAVEEMLKPGGIPAKHAGIPPGRAAP